MAKYMKVESNREYEAMLNGQQKKAVAADCKGIDYDFS